MSNLIKISRTIGDGEEAKTETVTTTKKAFEGYFSSQGYVRDEPDEPDELPDHPPFLEVSPPGIPGTAQPRLHGAAKAAANRKAKKQG